MEAMVRRLVGVMEADARDNWSLASALDQRHPHMQSLLAAAPELRNAMLRDAARNERLERGADKTKGSSGFGFGAIVYEENSRGGRRGGRGGRGRYFDRRSTENHSDRSEVRDVDRKSNPYGGTRGGGNGGTMSAAGVHRGRGGRTSGPK